MARVGLAWHGLEDRPLTTSTPALLPNGREDGAVDGSRTRQILLTMEAPSHESSDGIRCARLESNQHLRGFGAALPPGQLRAQWQSRRVESNHPVPDYETGALPRELRRREEAPWRASVCEIDCHGPNGVPLPWKGGHAWWTREVSNLQPPA
jgi:hypothetical protein